MTPSSNPTPAEPLAHLYVLVFPRDGVIKIGKANDVLKRVQSLCRHWGKVDYAGSYSVQLPEMLVFRLERSLHLLFGEHSVEFDAGDGRTELFAASALPHVLDHLELFLRHSAVAGKLEKGIRAPIASPTARRRREDHLAKASREHFRLLARLQRNFLRINRFLRYLLRRETRIAFEYELEDGQVFFRLRLSSPGAIETASSIARLFSFDIRGIVAGGYECNTCSYCAEGDVLQFEVRRLAPKRDGLLFYYMASQAEAVLRLLPRRSSAATEPIPRLDGEQIMRDILSYAQRQDSPSLA